MKLLSVARDNAKPGLHLTTVRGQHKYNKYKNVKSSWAMLYFLFTIILLSLSDGHFVSSLRITELFLFLSDVAPQFLAWLSLIEEYCIPFYHVQSILKDPRQKQLKDCGQSCPEQTTQRKPNQCRSVLTSTDQLVSIDSSHIQSLDCVTTVLLYCNLSLCQSCQPGHFVCHPQPHAPLTSKASK